MLKAVRRNRSVFFDSQRRNKQTIVVIGSGWGGFRAALDLDREKYNVHLVSPRNHFLFTPLLPSTAVGTLEFRAIQEPVRTIPNLNYHQAYANNIDFDNSLLHCSDVHDCGYDFSIKYDSLILAAGCETNTFNVKGVQNNERVFFLKQLQHARAIRNRLIDNFERANSLGATDEAYKRRLLTFVVVGGGPTSVEFCAELHDFIKNDVARWYPDLFAYTKIVIVEASEQILGSFTNSIVSYIVNILSNRKVDILTNTAVTEIKENICVLNNGDEIPFGLMVWSTGLKQIQMIENIDQDSDYNVARTANGRLSIDNNMKLMIEKKNSSKDKYNSNITTLPNINNKIHNVFALGDCAANHKKPLPGLAQVASQQGAYLAKQFNTYGIDKMIEANETNNKVPPFKYQHLGSMVEVGEWQGVYDSANIDPNESTIISKTIPSLNGVIAYVLWRAAYWTRQVSLSNKLMIPMYWFHSFLFGRDISRF